MTRSRAAGARAAGAKTAGAKTAGAKTAGAKTAGAKTAGAKAVGELGPGRRGRRPAGENTRAAIIDAARAEFSARGYDASSLRAIARLAEVDPALVHHYFDGKAALFVEAMSLPVNPSFLMDSILAGPREQVGEALARTFFRVWDDPKGRERLVALVRSAVSNEDAARMLREFLGREIFGKVAVSMGVPQPHLRAGMAAAQLVGVAMMRYVVGFEPLVRASVDDIVALLAPTLQRYLANPSASLA